MGVEVVEVVDQRVTQRRGGLCARYPVSCLIRDMVNEVGVDRC
mgnify:CR=1 FL=1